MRLVTLTSKQRADLRERKRRIQKKCRAIDAARLRAKHGEKANGIYRA